MSEHFDILVVGAGPAGIAAAVSASAAGKRVGLVDDNPAAGGQIWRKRGSSARGRPQMARKTRRRASVPASGLASLRPSQARHAARRMQWRLSRTVLRPDHSGDRGARTLPAISGMDAAQCDGSGRPGRDGPRRVANRWETRSRRRNWSAASRGCGASGASWRENRCPLRASSDAPVRSLYATSASRARQTAAGNRVRHGNARHSVLHQLLADCGQAAERSSNR